MQIQKIKKRILPTLFSLIAMLIILSPAYININKANATLNNAQESFGLTGGNGSASEINVSTSNTDLKSIVANLVNIALGFLGIIAVTIIIFAGFKWMTANGNEDQAGEAKKMITQAVIGLVIVFLAYIIISFVTSQLSEATTV